MRISSRFAKCVEKLGFVPNVYGLQPPPAAFAQLHGNVQRDHAVAVRPVKARAGDGGGVVVRQPLLLLPRRTWRGGAALSGDPELGEMMALNYRVAPWIGASGLMLDFAWKLTATPRLVDDGDREALRSRGLSPEDIFDLAETVAFFNLSNRMASATDMMPNREYHGYLAGALGRRARRETEPARDGTMALRGSCQCGGVKFEITGPLTGVAHCHCSQCRKAHSAAFRARAQ